MSYEMSPVTPPWDDHAEAFGGYAADLGPVGVEVHRPPPRRTDARRRDVPAVRRRDLGNELRRHREAAGLTLGHVAARLRCSASKISRIETGATGASAHVSPDAEN
jgi:ribosome-binding protein aMBF1 (putative translation factor)